jgi:uncharacterized protein
MSKATRDIAPDILRGFALWGIILVNVSYFSTSVDTGVTSEGVQSTGDAIAAFLVFVFGQGKFYLIFSFLFGYSAHYLLGNQHTGRTRWVTRSFGLIALGLAHASLLFIGDILFLYGVLALLLPAFYGRTRTTIVRWMGWLYGIFVAVLAALLALTWLGESQGFTATAPPSTARVAYGEAVATGSFLEAIPARWGLWSEEAVFLIFFQGVFTFIAFLAGILAARSQTLSPEGVTPATLRKMIMWGWGLGLGLQVLFGGIWLGNLVSASPTATLELWGIFGAFVTAPLLSIGYVGTVMWLIKTRPQLLGWLGSMGRMSLTVYLSQSVILSIIFGAWGLGLYQQVPYWWSVLISVGVTILLAVIARLWLSRFRQGPMEKLLTEGSKMFLPR